VTSLRVFLAASNQWAPFRFTCRRRASGAMSRPYPALI
jgi:hypothetical protein